MAHVLKTVYGTNGTISADVIADGLSYKRACRTARIESEKIQNGVQFAMFEDARGVRVPVTSTRSIAVLFTVHKL